MEIALKSSSQMQLKRKDICISCGCASEIPEMCCQHISVIINDTGGVSKWFLLCVCHSTVSYRMYIITPSNPIVLAQPIATYCSDSCCSFRTCAFLFQFCIAQFRLHSQVVSLCVEFGRTIWAFGKRVHRLQTYHRSMYMCVCVCDSHSSKCIATKAIMQEYKRRMWVCVCVFFPLFSSILIMLLYSTHSLSLSPGFSY